MDNISTWFSTKPKTAHEDFTNDLKSGVSRATIGWTKRRCQLMCIVRPQFHAPRAPSTSGCQASTSNCQWTQRKAQPWLLAKADFVLLYVSDSSELQVPSLIIRTDISTVKLVGISHSILYLANSFYERAVTFHSLAASETFHDCIKGEKILRATWNKWCEKKIYTSTSDGMVWPVMSLNASRVNGWPGQSSSSPWSSSLRNAMAAKYSAWTMQKTIVNTVLLKTDTDTKGT